MSTFVRAQSTFPDACCPDMQTHIGLGPDARYSFACEESLRMEPIVAMRACRCQQDGAFVFDDGRVDHLVKTPTKSSRLNRSTLSDSKILMPSSPRLSGLGSSKSGKCTTRPGAQEPESPGPMTIILPKIPRLSPACIFRNDWGRGATTGEEDRNFLRNRPNEHCTPLSTSDTCISAADSDEKQISMGLSDERLRSAPKIGNYRY